MIKADTLNIARNKICNFARLQKGKEYIHGNHGPDNFDCAGFVWYVYKQVLNINIYERGFGQSTTTRIMTCNYGTITIFDEEDLNKDFSLIKEGDILLFHTQSKEDCLPLVDNKYPGHCGIYLGNNFFIHCSSKKRKVVIARLDKECWIKKLVASKDIISSEKIKILK